jgi:hypothetical protein
MRLSRKPRGPALPTCCELLLVIALGLSSCGPVNTTASTFTAVTPPTTELATASATAQGSTFSDPFAYCSAIGNSDTPGPTYTGPKMPQTIAAGLKKASGASPDAPLDIFVQGSFWRCMNGKVYACFVGANLPCDSKANTDKTPTAAETDFCKANPNSDVVPAVVTGHDTIYEWRCGNGVPEIVKQVFQVDERGYISEIWYLISPQ